MQFRIVTSSSFIAAPEVFYGGDNYSDAGGLFGSRHADAIAQDAHRDSKRGLAPIASEYARGQAPARIAICASRFGAGPARSRTDARPLIWSPLSIALAHRWWWVGVECWIDEGMRRERCFDDGSDSYPWVGYQHSIYPSWACLALGTRVNASVASEGSQGLPIGLSSHLCIDPWWPPA